LIFSENPEERDKAGQEKEEKEGKEKLGKLQLSGAFCAIRNPYQCDAFESQNKPPMDLERKQSDGPACALVQGPANRDLRDNTRTPRTCDQRIIFCTPSKKRIILVGYECMRDSLGEVIRFQ
jgi:hypothetical protein